MDIVSARKRSHRRIPRFPNGSIRFTAHASKEKTNCTMDRANTISNEPNCFRLASLTHVVMAVNETADRTKDTKPTISFLRCWLSVRLKEKDTAPDINGVDSFRIVTLEGIGRFTVLVLLSSLLMGIVFLVLVVAALRRGVVIVLQLAATVDLFILFNLFTTRVQQERKRKKEKRGRFWWV